MPVSILLVPCLLAAPAEWRSQEFLKARAEVDKARDAKGGIGVIVEIKRTSATVIKGVAEVRGHGRWVLSWAPAVDQPAQSKPEVLVTWNLEGSFSLARPITIDFSVAEGVSKATFTLKTEDFGTQAWQKPLPAGLGGSIVWVFYIPEK